MILQVGFLSFYQREQPGFGAIFTRRQRHISAFRRLRDPRRREPRNFPKFIDDKFKAFPG